ncbi:Xaa-Pro aminopeptidase [Spironucleus salmonicida]|uniref:Xaa-Pro aminopeptidase n=1 Tax=Spironucleus salmonicida TaxID=348837 RepID=V6LVL4_9EUKA|nr:Xaa-Pro aminopeptidase [Spironucleus salmonicida]|eukprot:EST48640.1 Xaa-Pro dipeptidase [Spironucleus salmonicida]
MTLYFTTSDNADFLYASKFIVHDPVFLLVNSPQQPKIYVSELEFGRAQKESCCEVFLREKGFKDHEYALKITEDITDLKVNYNFPAGLFKKIQEQRQIDVIESCIQEREIKTEQEVQHLINANKISMKCFDKIKNILSESTIQGEFIIYNNTKLTSETLRIEVKKVILENGGISDYEPIIACGVQGCDPHCIGTGNIIPNQAIVCDIFPRADTLYYADMTRTFVKGKPSNVLKKQYEKVLEVQQHAIQMVKPGMRILDIAKYVEDAFAKDGYKKELIDDQWCGMIHGLGHGVGLDLHEAPSVNTRVAEDKVCIINQVFTIEPGLYYHKVGGVRIEDDIRVTEHGVEVITPYSYDWIIK